MPLITTSYAVALLVSIVLFVKGGKAAKKSLNPKGNTGNKINDFIVGRELNPRIKSFDFKLFFKRHALLTAVSFNLTVFSNFDQFVFVRANNKIVLEGLKNNSPKTGVYVSCSLVASRKPPVLSVDFR